MMIHRHAQRGTAAKTITITLVVLVALVAAYFAVVLNWNYSTGERAGWVQKFSKKGWLCKTWEGELALVTMPGTTQEKFLFTVWDDAIAEQINKAMGKRVSLRYDEKVGLPTTCFGETRHFVTGVRVVEDIPLAPGIVVPSPAAPVAPAAPAQAPAPAAPVQSAPAIPASPPNEYSPQPASPK